MRQIRGTGWLLMGVALLISAGRARADDGELSYGGSPSLLNGTGSVTMQSEVVIMDIGPKDVIVDCNFVFKNTGRACTVRMGFPDTDASGESFNAEKPQSVFNWFRSSVDGKPMKTVLVVGRNQTVWQSKLVSFPTHGTRRVRDVYSVPVGGQVVANGKGYFNQTSYVLHTGASWRGNIGRAEIIARFRRVKRPHPTPGATWQSVLPLSLKKVGNARINALKWTRPDREVVIFDGPGTPTASKNTLRWVRTNFRPAEKDDIYLIFKSHPEHDTP